MGYDQPWGWRWRGDLASDRGSRVAGERCVFASRMVSLKCGGCSVNKGKRAQLWNEVQRRHRLSDEVVLMGMELGLNPKKLPTASSNELWKVPTEEWIRTIYAKRFKKN